MKARKLKSGSWNCQVYIGTKDVIMPDGSIKKKRIRKSITVADPSPHGRKLCEKKASEYLLSHENGTDIADEMTVREAIEQYCLEKNAVLSPTTIKGYQSILRSRMDGIGDIKLLNLTARDVQKWVNDLTRGDNLRRAGKLSPKTVKNLYGLLAAVLNAYIPDRKIHIRLPQQVRPDLYVPSDADIQAIIGYFSANDKDMLNAVYLAAFGTLRRSEVCALSADDISGNILHIRRALVEDGSGHAVEKTTKTYSSQRDIEMPDFIIDQFPKEGKIVNLTPQAITHRFCRALEKLEIPHFRFHDLRHYSASVMHAIGIPDKYIMDRGGWSDDGTLKRIYRNSMDEYTKMYNQELNDHIVKIANPHESPHGSDEKSEKSPQ